MFTVKATYRGETRKLSFPECNTFPSFDQLYHQLYRVFPISHAIVLSKLLFSPDASKSRVLVSREVRTADEYNLVVAPFRGRLWSNPLLRFSVSDETPHKLPAIAHLSQPNASNPQKPVVSDAFHVAEPSFGRISYSHIPPPPIIFSSRPSPQEPMDVGSSFKAEAEAKALPRIPQPDQLMDVTPCCAVSQTKKDIQNLIAGFKVDLDSTIASLDKRSQEAEQVRSPTPPMIAFQRPTASESTLSLPSVPVYPPLCQFNFCSGCTVIKQGAWFDCQKCNNKLCVTCHDSATAGDCFVGTGPHVWKKQTCTYCIEPSVPLPPHPIMSWGSVPSLNNFASPLLPSVPTMPPVVRDEPTLDTAVAPPPVPVAVPATEPVVNESVRNDSGRVVHHGVGCDVCSSVIVGIRHKCLDCPDYDLCTSCITSGSAESHNPFHEFFEISEPGRVVVHNVFSGRGEREAHGSPTRRRSREFSPRVSPAVVHNATCDLCESRIRGARYKCVECPDYDVCKSCFSITEEHHPGHGFVKLIRPDDFIRREKAVTLHLANCNSCKKQIRGIRYKCMHPECLDFDLCQDCEALPIAVHPSTHPFLKLKDTDTTIPLVVRPNPVAPQPFAYNFGASVRSPSPSRQPSPVSSRAPSPPGRYEAGFMRNPGMRVEGISSPEIPPPPSPFYFRSESSRCQSPEYRYLNRSPSPVRSPTIGRELYTRVQRSLSPGLSRTPSPPMMIPGAMPTMFTLPPLKSLSPLRTPPTEDNEPEDRAPSPLWKYTPYSRPAPYARSHSPLLIPGQFVPESHFSTRSSTPEPVCGYPVMAPVGMEHNASPAPPSPDWRQVYSPGSPFPVRLPAQSAPVAPREEPSHVLPPVQSLAVNSGFWPENFQEILGIRHLMEDEPSFSRDLRWSVDENQALVEESPLIGEGEPLLNRPASSDALANLERAGRSLASVLSNIQGLSTNNPFLTAMETERHSMGTPEAPIPAVVSLPSSPVVLEPLNAEYVADRSIPDGQVVAPGAEFLKAWVMRNGGNRAWPEDTELVFVAGESLAKDSATMQPRLVGAVQPMEQIDLWTDELKAPEVPGRYVSYYRLRDGEGNLFGHSIWLDITVSETFHRDSPDALTSSEEYMSSSSIIVMPHNAPTRASAVVEDDHVEEQSPHSSVPGSPITALSNGDDEISDSDSETSGSLLSVPDSDSDDELWQDSRSVFIEGSQATLRVSNETQEPDEYVVLYDETTSSEEGE